MTKVNNITGHKSIQNFFINTLILINKSIPSVLITLLQKSNTKKRGFRCGNPLYLVNPA